MRLLLCCAALAASLLAAGAQAQAGYPARPIRVIVNFPPGGAADVIARTVAQPLQEALGQPAINANSPIAYTGSRVGLG